MAEGTDGNLLKFVKVYAAETGVTVDSIGRAVGCGHTAFYAKLNGKSQLKLGEAHRLAEALGITLDKLWRLSPEVNHE